MRCPRSSRGVAPEAPGWEDPTLDPREGSLRRPLGEKPQILEKGRSGGPWVGGPFCGTLPPFLWEALSVAPCLLICPSLAKPCQA